MVLDPAKRPTATELLDDPYFQLGEAENSEIHAESTTPIPASGSATDCRFVFADDDAYQASECYAPGGLCPLQAADVLGNPPRYRIISELGVGRSSTVWLARDRVSSQYVTLKILMAKRTAQSQESVILRRVTVPASLPPVKHRVMQLIDSFDQILKGTLNDRIRMSCAKQSFIHSHGVVHGDLQASSFGISVPEINKYSDIAMWTFNGPGGAAPSVDFAGFIFRRISELRERAPSPTARVVGGSVASKLPETSLFYATPELVFLRVALNADTPPSDQRSDIWSLAVTFHELVTVQKIFPDDNPADLPHLIVALCGEIISIRMRVLRVGWEPGRTVELWKEIEDRFTSSGVDDPAGLATLICQMMMADPARRPRHQSS
ncbi:kinase-like domain-containing protein [Mycena olivaceomarginata]|nr:kinase-like domain-containing protein [Mycena olivaceomarginata]